MTAGAWHHDDWVDLFSIKAGFYRRTHFLPTHYAIPTLIQTNPKTFGLDTQVPCEGTDGGSILMVGGDKLGVGPMDEIWVFSLQHGWFKSSVKLPWPRHSLRAVVIP